MMAPRVHLKTRVIVQIRKLRYNVGTNCRKFLDLMTPLEMTSVISMN